MSTGKDKFTMTFIDYNWNTCVKGVFAGSEVYGGASCWYSYTSDLKINQNAHKTYTHDLKNNVEWSKPYIENLAAYSGGY